MRWAADVRLRHSALRAAIGATSAVAAWPALALAQALDDPAAPEVGSGVVSLSIWDWLNLVLRLGAVIAIIWAAFWAMRWYSRRIQAGYGTSRALQLLETRALGPNRSLQLVRVGHRAVLVGVTPDRINQLLEIDDPDEVERLTIAATEPRASSSTATALAGLISRLSRTATGPRTRAQPSAPFAFASSEPPVAPPFEAMTNSDGTYAPAAHQLQATAAYRNARIVELQRAIEDARRGTMLEGLR